jgi:hypothetical protein
MARRKKRAAQKPARRVTSLRVELSLPRLEMARGHDGLLRGEPEPVVVFGAYYTDGQSVRALGRAHVRFSPRGAYPLVVAAEGSHALAAPVLPAVHERERIVVLAIALEEDSGKDVARVYGAMENAASFAVWPREEAVPAPRALSATFDDPVMRVYVLEDGRDLRAVCTGDELIGAVVATLPVSRARHELRLPFVSERNDWLAILVASI